MSYSSYHKKDISGRPLHAETQMMSYGFDPFLSEGAVKPPVFLTSTFAFRSAEDGAEFFDLVSGRKPLPQGESAGLVYSRFNHPNLEIVEDRLSLLDGSEDAAVTSSGIAGSTLETVRTAVRAWLVAVGATLTTGDTRIDVVPLGATLLVVAVLRSRIGLALRAVRDSESGARALGVDAVRTKLVVWVLAAFWTGCTGAVILLNTTSTRSDSAFSIADWTALVIFIVVIGGVGSTAGPIFGVGVYWLLERLLDDADTWRFIVLGALAAVMAIVAPGGLYGLVNDRRPVELFPVRRRLSGEGVP